MINGRVENAAQFARALDGVQQRTIMWLKKVIAKNSRLLQTHTRAQYMSGIYGAGKSALRRRSGTLAARTVPIPVHETAPGVVIGGLSFGTRYAATHIGPRGTSITIRKKDKLLAIPLPAMKTKAGVARGGTAYAREKYDRTYVAKSRKGNLLIFGQKKMATGTKTIPLFLLREEVTIRRRIHPEDLIDWIEPRILNDMKGLGNAL